MKFEMTIEEDVPAPPVRKHRKRLTPELRGMQPGQSVVVDDITAKCIRDFGYRNGWEVVTKAVRDGVEMDGKIRVWRVS